MRWNGSTLGLTLLVCFLVLSPTRALANCEAGGALTYSDVTDIDIYRCGTVGFVYDLWAKDDGFLAFSGKYNTPVQGYYEGHDGKPLFAHLLAILRNEDFLSIRLKPSPTLYIDGPCQSIAVMRCGVTTVVGGLGSRILPFEADIKDGETRRLNALVDKLQALIFAWPWHSEHQDMTPQPSATPHRY